MNGSEKIEGGLEKTEEIRVARPEPHTSDRAVTQQVPVDDV